MFRIFCLLALLIAASGCAATAPVAPPLSSTTPSSTMTQAAPPQAQAAVPAPVKKKPVAVAKPAPKIAAAKPMPQPAVKVPLPAPAAPAPAPAPAPVPTVTAPAVTAPPAPVAANAPPAGTEKPGLAASALGVVTDWRDYWYVDLGLLLLLLLLLWLLTRRRGEEPARTATGPPQAQPRPPPVAAASGTESPFARSGITIGRGAEFCVLRFINQGREQAAVEGHCLALAVERVLPPTPLYPAEAVECLASPLPVETRQQFSVERPNRLSDQDWERIQRGEAALWLYGYFDYRDAQRTLRRQGFCYAYLPPAAASIPPGNGRAAAAGPPAYTYSRLAG